MNYDADYYERGLELGISGYSNYRWIPELTIPMAHHIVRHLGIDEMSHVLDFGAAKGYITKALRLMGYNAWAYDISEYAREHADADVKSCFYAPDELFDTLFPVRDTFTHVIAKDVLEHVPYQSMNRTLQDIRETMKDDGLLYFLVPLATDGKYRVKFYERDVTHVIRKDELWWITLMQQNGFEIVKWSHHFMGIKDNWATHTDGNLQCIVKKT